jgi:hypothetical protein
VNARRERRSTDETAGLAGWMYTDLLLGLVVVFLGAVAFTIKQPDDSAEAGGPTTTPTSSTTTTTTSPAVTTTTLPVELCTTLYAPAGAEEEKKNGIWFEVPAKGSSEQLVAEFGLGLTSEIDAENARLTDGRFIDPTDPRIGLIIAWGGFPADSDPNVGAETARNVVDRLRFSLPETLGSSVVRYVGTRTVSNGRVGLEIYPLLEGPCTT